MGFVWMLSGAATDPSKFTDWPTVATALPFSSMIVNGLPRAEYRGGQTRASWSGSLPSQKQAVPSALARPPSTPPTLVSARASGNPLREAGRDQVATL
jgi:hypothetical protein